jgi:cytochrome c biogenesis protein ResB
MKVGEKVQVNENLFVTPTKVFPDLIVDENGNAKNRSYSLNNPAVYLQFSNEKAEDNKINDVDRWIFQKFGDVHYQRATQSNPQIPRFKLIDFGPIAEEGAISVLKVSSQPGLSLIYSGFGLLMIGLIFSFYIFHRRIWVSVDKKSGKILIGGKCNKKISSFESEINEIFKIVSTRRGTIYE